MGYPRSEMEEMWRRWTAANEAAEAASDWTGLGAFYTEDAVYTWTVGHYGEFAARGRQDIIDHVLGFEMIGFEGWTYPYEKVVIDDSRSEIVGYWSQVTPFEDEAGRRVRANGLGCSWFRYAGDFKWSEQLDLFDIDDVQGVLKKLNRLGLLSEEFKARQQRYVDGTAPGSRFV